MSDRDELRMCAVCGRTLEETHRPDGQILYQHSLVEHALGEADHPPVAVRASDAPRQQQPRCDFCLEEPVTHTMVLDKELGIPGVIQWSTEWAMCQVCSELAFAEKWLDLRRRSFALQTARFGPMDEGAAMNMRVVMRDMRRSVVMYYSEQ